MNASSPYLSPSPTAPSVARTKESKEGAPAGQPPLEVYSRESTEPQGLIPSPQGSTRPASTAAMQPWLGGLEGDAHAGSLSRSVMAGLLLGLSLVGMTACAQAGHAAPAPPESHISAVAEKAQPSSTAQKAGASAAERIERAGEAAAVKGHTLYLVRGDVDGDGRPESVSIVGSRSANPGEVQDLRLVVQKKAGGKLQTVFVSESFNYRFQTESDHLADELGGLRSGVHIRKGDGKYPAIHVVFASCSEDMAVFQYDGATYRVLPASD